MSGDKGLCECQEKRDCRNVGGKVTIMNMMRNGIVKGTVGMSESE